MNIHEQLTGAKDYDLVDYILHYDCHYTNDVIFIKDSFKHSDGCIVPIVYQSHGHDCHERENQLGGALIENRDDGIVAKCLFYESTEGEIAKRIFADGEDLGITVYANRIEYDTSCYPSLRKVTSANVMAVVVVPKIAIPLQKKEETL